MIQRHVFHVQQGAVSTCHLLLHPYTVNDVSSSFLIYCPFPMGPSSRLSTSYFFSWFFFPTIPFSTQKTLTKQHVSGTEGMKVTYFGRNRSRRKPCQMPHENCNTCWLKIVAYAAQGKTLFFSFKLWLEKPIFMNQFISHWLASLISSSNDCNRKYKAAL